MTITNVGKKLIQFVSGSKIASAMSFFKYRTEMFQPYLRVVAGGLPINLGMNLFSVRLLCVNLAAHLFNGVEPAIQD